MNDIIKPVFLFITIYFLVVLSTIIIFAESYKVAVLILLLDSLILLTGLLIYDYYRKTVLKKFYGTVDYAEETTKISIKVNIENKKKVWLLAEDVKLLLEHYRLNVLNTKNKLIRLSSLNIINKLIHEINKTIKKE